MRLTTTKIGKDRFRERKPIVSCSSSARSRGSLTRSTRDISQVLAYHELATSIHLPIATTPYAGSTLDPITQNKCSSSVPFLGAHSCFHPFSLIVFQKQTFSVCDLTILSWILYNWPQWIHERCCQHHLNREPRRYCIASGPRSRFAYQPDHFENLISA